MILHYFNPWHDEALANGSPYYCPSRAATRLEREWAVLPAWWAAEGDAVLVPEMPSEEWLRKAKPYIHPLRFVTPAHVPSLSLDGISPWGWDALVCRRLERWGVDKALLPGAAQLEHIKTLSSRHTAVKFLKTLRRAIPHLVGESCYCTSWTEVLSQCTRPGSVLLKAPWSSSGRGLRQIDGAPGPDDRGWACRVLRKQGSVVVEPLYDKVMDFAMEFRVTNEVSYVGYSIFTTRGHTYAGNIVCSEEEAEQRLAAHVPVEQLHAVRQHLMELIQKHFVPIYQGMVGVDMMVVKHEGELRIHPCVEINVRTTMGCVAIQCAKTNLQFTMYNLQ